MDSWQTKIWHIPDNTGQALLQSRIAKQSGMYKKCWQEQAIRHANGYEFQHSESNEQGWELPQRPFWDSEIAEACRHMTICQQARQDGRHHTPYWYEPRWLTAAQLSSKPLNKSGAFSRSLRVSQVSNLWPHPTHRVRYSISNSLVGMIHPEIALGCPYLWPKLRCGFPFFSWSRFGFRSLC